ncbi:hypothetical protein Acsp04_66610 [Actinomadura sp. NBRC 104425]|uniref:hypothetical protein n=1 Tax=Actinomadura sp. NBRC 104425 TaxID=3032204 RepID=UPI0024A20E01|nr:hypothetical protein [Actinomadura sp. NBRC 104425]GLZ16426.1 hypothetical protein Acsp04_66610 [Actinomadura sp. NBRC 104425]
MVDLTEYERRGDLDAPFELTKKHERAQKTAERIREAVRCDVAPLTWEAYVAGEPCPGCGLPYRDEEPWDFKGTMYFTEEERARYDAEQARFKKAHGDCRSHRHSVSGSLTMHCGKCCPPPPLPPRQIGEIGRLLGTPKQPHELMRWRLRLYCGHVVEKQAHYTHKTLHSAFTGSTSCPECGLDPATIVDGEAVGLVEEPPGPAKPSPAAPPAEAHESRAGSESARTGSGDRAASRFVAATGHCRPRRADSASTPA